MDPRPPTPPANPRERIRGPLAGVRVLDLSRLLPGPFASLVLADLGARVDKIEDPGAGDYLRAMPPMRGDTSSMFLALNRNKRSACLDLKMERGRAALLKLAARYDVLLEQFRPGVLDRLGLGHRTLLEANPRLIVCALTGYGQDGPLAQRAGHDLNYLARAGVLGMNGPAGAPPQVPGFQLADIGGGLWCVAGILAALYRRNAAEASGGVGEGSVIDVSMLESSMSFAFSGFGQLFGGALAARGEGPLTGGLALYGTYGTQRRPLRHARRARAEVLAGVLRRRGRSCGLAVRRKRPLPRPAPGGPQGDAARRLRVAHASRVGGLRARARLLPRAGARARRAPERRAAPCAPGLLRDRLALGPASSSSRRP